MRRVEVAQIERVVAAGVAGQEIKAEIAGALHHGGVGGRLDHHELFAAIKQQLDDARADATRAAHHDVAAPTNALNSG